MSSQYPDQSFRITTSRIAVTIRLTQGAPLSGAFSSARPSNHAGSAAGLVDLLDQPPRFVPFFPAGRDLPVLIGKHAIRLVELDAESDATPEQLGEVRNVELLLDDGTELRGRIRISAPLGHTRTLDNLNEAGRFIALYSPQRVVLVHLAWVVLAADLG